MLTRYLQSPFSRRWFWGRSGCMDLQGVRPARDRLSVCAWGSSSRVAPILKGAAKRVLSLWTTRVRSRRETSRDRCIHPTSGRGDWLRLAVSLANRLDHPVSTAASRYWPEHAGGVPVSAVTLRATLLDQRAFQTISIVSHQTFQFDDTTAM